MPKADRRSRQPPMLSIAVGISVAQLCFELMCDPRSGRLPCYPTAADRRDERTSRWRRGSKQESRHSRQIQVEALQCLMCAAEHVVCLSLPSWRFARAPSRCARLRQWSEGNSKHPCLGKGCSTQQSYHPSRLDAAARLSSEISRLFPTPPASRR